MILFVQPYGLGSPGGSSRIFRALLKDSPTSWLSVAATNEPTPIAPFGEELQFRGRPYFGRLERSRLAHWPRYLDLLASRRLVAKLHSLVQEHKVRAIHTIAHNCWDMLAAFKVARRFCLPFFLSVHDDPAHLLKNHPLKAKLLEAAADCWLKADARFVISKEMGQELCRRWGRKDYILVTDGLTDIVKLPRPQQPNRLTVYFMGLPLLPYEPNFVALQKALRIISEKQPELKVSLILRCGRIRKRVVVYPEIVRELPFGREADVQTDMENADVLYQPLSLEPEQASFCAYSLSTKMITYLGSGLPILFHGPSDSAAGKLLAKNRAALICDSNDSQRLAQVLTRAIGRERDQVVLSALKLAEQQFRLIDVRERFWNAMMPKV